MERGAVTDNAQAGADALVWIDLEMTGLVAERDVIIEIACVVTTADLTPVDEGVQADHRFRTGNR